MSERTSKKPGIADYVAARRKHKDCFLDEIDRLIDWKPLEKVLHQKIKRVANAVGNPAYSPLLMFKILLLQRWYNLSDAAVEEALCDRLSFVRFVALSLDHDEVPDSTTICRFRQSLVERNILKRLLDKLNHQLERRGLLVREGAIVDASVVSSVRSPLKVLDVLPEDREENAGDAPDVTISYSDDADAAWLRKGNRAYYGYKIHAATDIRRRVDSALLGHAQEHLPVALTCVPAHDGLQSCVGLHGRSAHADPASKEQAILTGTLRTQVKTSWWVASGRRDRVRLSQE